MRKLLLILFIINLALLCNCKDPSALDANRDITITFDPNNLPAEFQLTPDTVDFGIVKPNQITSKSINIKNITKNRIILEKLQANSFISNYIFKATLPIILEPKNNSEDNRNFELSFMGSEAGNYDSQIDFGKYKNPITILKAKVASVWANDIEFADTKVGDFDLSFLNIYNSSNYIATITEFKIIGDDGVLINEPEIKLPIEIAANSISKDIFLTFAPKGIKSYNLQIQIKANYSGGINYTYETINLRGKGVQ